MTTSAESQIRVLPTHVANKIAAGEVVERPASVVKELVENAIDAGGQQIDLEIAVGGRKLVSVTDDGRGMNRDDALLSIERQATSKIRDVDNIESIATLGFRGEALAAIASVSRFRLTTCRQGGITGTELTVTGGKLTDVRDVGFPAGTRIEVRDLFFNVPARRKFLRTQQTELSHIRACFMIQALAHPELGMSLTLDGRETYRLAAGGTLDDRIRDLFGSGYGHNLRAVDHVANGVRVTGYASLPTVNRADRYEQYVFVNGRATSAPVVGYAIREGYHGAMPGDRHPSVFLFIELDPEQVDVNVHPTKREVRFRRSGDVRDAVIGALRLALGTGAPPGPGAVGGAAPPEPEPEPPRPTAEMAFTIEDLPVVQGFRYPRIHVAAGADMPADAPFDAGPSDSPALESASGTGMPAEPGRSPWAWCRVVGQIGGLYVVLETEDGFVLMDPHAAHERVLFEQFMGDVLEGGVQTQALLLPETIELQARDALRVRKHLALFKGMGFGICEFGGDAFVVDALPSYFSGASATRLLLDVVKALEESGARGGKGRWREETIAQAACKAAVKARDKLTLDEIERLVVDLARTEMPYTCPHGRPTLIFTSYRDLQKKFGRT